MNPLYTDAPEVRAIVAKAFPGYRGRRFTVEVFSGPMRLESYWSGGFRDYWAFVVLEREDHGAVGHVPENGTPWNKSLGPLTELPVGCALVRHTMGPCESACVYVRPENITKLLPAPVCLTKDQKTVLAATAGLKSSYGGIKNYRFHEANRQTGIALQDWDQAKAECIALGFLNGAGAITDKGRNAIGNVRLQNLKVGAQ